MDEAVVLIKIKKEGAVMPDRNKDAKKSLRGVLTLHSETGTEGGYWAFQNERFIKKNVPRPWCKKCGKWLARQKSQNIQVKRVLPANDVLNDKEPSDCSNGEHEREIGDEWSYKGLHILKNGDKLTVYDIARPNEVVWSGVISLKQYPPFTEDAFGYWIHADQIGINRETWAKWFFEEYPAELTPATNRE